MKYLIVEDERFAYEELRRMMAELRPGYLLEKHTKTVVDTIAFLKTSRVDLILMDIRLADGNCFEIFNHVEVATPVIFTTAYDEHAIKAFKFNSIDYLLKPFDENELEAALTKFESIFHNHSYKAAPKNFEQIISVQNKNRFLISKAENYHYIETADIAHFYSEDGVVFLHTFSDKRHIINYTLDQLEQRLDNRLFFRVSRNCIGNVGAIDNVAKYLGSRLKISFLPACPHEVLVSRVRVSNFLNWMDGIVE
ncbi:LytTR family DNA-binding domain-containing protein [Dyadobacter sp. LJ53]|uniref:LytR/AlgR family response regulator transcription factor n=1 Tax=Dyadobacter chenwenxiniae TaxID=2906456 RepID=UPI001F195171|nr:LytTR family DNA-binding domain-containing protein [Dyadobacter chenwenxiniae]MCF0051678.1 LytTR family DNA-binding domain-containing protein [Dyadobacter chenwenxiniae]